MSNPRNAFRMIAVTALLAACLRAQDTGTVSPAGAPVSPSNSTFRIDIDNVQVPVLVTGKDGRPVSGLKREDFVLLEDGKPKRIVSLDVVAPGTEPLLPEVPQDGTFSNRVGDGRSGRRLTIVALDLINSTFIDQTACRNFLTKYFANVKEDGALYELVVFTRRGVRVLHDFTLDSNRLIAQIQGLKMGMRGERTTDQARTEVNTFRIAPPQSDAANFFLAGGSSIDLDQWFRSFYADDVKYQTADAILLTLQSFQFVAETTGGIPGRKSLVWLTGSFPFSTEEGNAYLNAGQPKLLFEHTMQQMSRSNVAIYPVDLRGLVVNGLPDSSVKWSRKNVGNLPLKKEDNELQDQVIAGAALQQATSIDTLKELAEMTGGVAYYNNNDVGESLRKASEDGAQYYLLSFTPSGKTKKEGWRKLSVRVQRPGVHVRARKGYYFHKAAQDTELMRRQEVGWALQSPLPFTSLPLSVRWVEIMSTDSGKRRVKYEVEIPAGTVTIDRANRNAMKLDFAVVAQSKKGDGATSRSQTYSAQLTPEHADQATVFGVTYTNVIEVPEGDYEVRLVVRDNLNGRIGSLVAPLHTGELSAVLEPKLQTRPPRR